MVRGSTLSRDAPRKTGDSLEPFQVHFSKRRVNGNNTLYYLRSHIILMSWKLIREIFRKKKELDKVLLTLS